jgi:hypothetical protein
MRRSRLLPILLPALALVVAAPAHALVTYDYSAAGLSFTADGSDLAETVVLSCVGGEVAPAAATPAPCATLTRLSVSPGNGPDDVDLTGVTASDFPDLEEITVTDVDDFPFDEVLGSELDEVIEVSVNDVVDAGAGDDVVTGGDAVEGGPGDDVLIQVSGDEYARGGAGDDRFLQTLAPGGNDGGPGRDLMEIDYDRTGVRSDGVVVVLTAAELQVLAAAGDVTAPVTGFEELHFSMIRGDGQSFDASAFPGRVTYTGSRQGDTVVGSGLRDLLEPGAGDDTVQARDGGVDVVDCGTGVDTAVVDPEDLVVGCESVSYPRPQTSAVSGPRRIAKGARASYAFASSIDGSVFQCRIDAGRWRACSSPTTVVAKGKLRRGRHTLAVRAGFPAGNWDTTPSTKRFTVRRS